ESQMQLTSEEVEVLEELEVLSTHGLPFQIWKHPMRRNSDDRCDGCLEPWGDPDDDSSTPSMVSRGPTLKEDIWLQICRDRPRDVLCSGCVVSRIMDRYRRWLRIDDLKPCPFNIYNGWYESSSAIRRAFSSIGGAPSTSMNVFISRCASHYDEQST